MMLGRFDPRLMRGRDADPQDLNAHGKLSERRFRDGARPLQFASFDTIHYSRLDDTHRAVLAGWIRDNLTRDDDPGSWDAPAPSGMPILALHAAFEAATGVHVEPGALIEALYRAGFGAVLGSNARRFKVRLVAG